jgi:hypothetical protein
MRKVGDSRIDTCDEVERQQRKQIRKGENAEVLDSCNKGKRQQRREM